MARSTDDKYTSWREVIFGVVAIGLAFSSGIGMTLGASSAGEFYAAYTFFSLTAVSFLVCYLLWLMGRHRSRRRRLLWGLITLISIVTELGITLPWVYNKQKKPDVTICFVNYQHPDLVVLNASTKSVDHASYFIALFNLDAAVPDEPLHIVGKELDVMLPNSISGPYDIFREINDSPTPKTGDRIAGSMSIKCPLCATGHAFYISFTWGGNDGWFSEIKDLTSGNLRIPMDLSNPQNPHLSSAGVLRQIVRVPETEHVPMRNLQQFTGANKSIDLFKCMVK